MRAVEYSKTGGPEVLTVVEVEEPEPGPGQALVSVEAAGINPYDYKVVSGTIDTGKPFPRRVGGDLAGTIVSVGKGAAYWDGTPMQVGDRVMGSGSGALAEQVIVTGKAVTLVPEGLDIETAGALNVPGLTATSLMATVPVGPADTLLVGGATGAVGMIACQIAAQAGARVIGTAGARNHGFLQEIGVEPVLYGPGLVERIEDKLKGGTERVTTVWDCHGREALDAGITLDVPRDRMVAIAAYSALKELGVLNVEFAARTPKNLAVLAKQVADGSIILPIVATYPLNQVADAFTALAATHAPGKIVVEEMQ